MIVLNFVSFKLRKCCTILVKDAKLGKWDESDLNKVKYRFTYHIPILHIPDLARLLKLIKLKHELSWYVV